MALSTTERINLVAEGDRAMTKLADTPAKVAALLVKMRAQLADAATGTVSVEPGTEGAVRAGRMQEARESAADLLQSYVSLAQGQRDNATKAFTEAASDRATDSAEALVVLLERQEAWKRIERRYPMPLAFEAVKEIAAAAASRGDRRTIEALRAEFPSSMARSSDPRPSSQAALVAAIEDQIDAIEVPLMSEPERAARAGLRELRQSWPRLETTFSLAEHEVKGRSMAGMLVNFDPKGTTFPVSA